MVGQSYQQLARASPRTYIGSGKVLEIQTAIQELGAQTIVFDDELSPGQQRALEKLLGTDVRLCDRTALILDIFAQRAATREGQLQVRARPVACQWPACWEEDLAKSRMWCAARACVMWSLYWGPVAGHAR